jgi:hypothetical protein
MESSDLLKDSLPLVPCLCFVMALILVDHPLANERNSTARQFHCENSHGGLLHFLSKARIGEEKLPPCPQA